MGRDEKGASAGCNSVHGKGITHYRITESGVWAGWQLQFIRNMVGEEWRDGAFIVGAVLLLLQLEEADEIVMLGMALHCRVLAAAVI